MTNEERERLPKTLRAIASAWNGVECECDPDADYQCEPCCTSFWLRRAAEEIERLRAEVDAVERAAADSKEYPR